LSTEDDKHRDEVLGRLLRTPPAPRRQSGRADPPARKPKPRQTTDEALEDLIEAIKGQDESR
jgi:hypothetical protein